MKITFLYHSAFLVELEGCTLLFDWYGGTLPDYDREKPLYVLASHHHGDHYSPEIFQALGMEGVWYVLATCIRLSEKRKKALGIQEEHVVRVAAGKTIRLEDLTVTTYRSTDAGVAFLVEAEGKRIFHSGDFHWWHWKEEPDPWNPDMERAFKKECEKLRGQTVDAAFLVLDPRQEEDFWMGFDWLMRTMEVKAAFPMHSWEEFWVTKKFLRLPCTAPYRDRIHPIYHNGQTFILE